MGNLFEGLTTSDKIRGVLASRSRTQADLADLLGITADTITSRMKQNSWTLKELTAIAAEFKIETSDLI